MIVIIFGLPGSGKSFFAQKLAEKMNADYVNTDKLRRELFSERLYTNREKSIVYEKMLDEMKRCARENKSLVLDGTFHNRETRKKFTDEMKDREQIIFIEIQADENIIRERLKRPRKYSEADFEVYKLIRQHNDVMEEPHLILQSTDNNIEEMMEKATKYLNLQHDN